MSDDAAPSPADEPHVPAEDPTPGPGSLSPADAATGALRTAIAEGRIIVWREPGRMVAQFEDLEPASIGSSPRAVAEAMRRRLRDFHDRTFGRQPSAAVLRALVDTLLSEAERMPAGDNRPRPRATGDGDGGTATAVLEKEESTGGGDAGIALDLLREAGVEPFRTPGDELFASHRIRGRRENVSIGSGALKTVLKHVFFQALKRPLKADPLAEAMGVLEGEALCGPVYEVHTRIAPGPEGSIYVDLNDEQGHVVHIDASGWRVLTDAPVRFRRPAGSAALPVPVRGGSLDELRLVLNLRDEDAWILLRGFLVGSIHPRGPYFVGVVNGEKGTAKSTTSGVILGVIDPKDTPLRRPPREERDLAIAARHSWLVAYNNLSHLSPRMSDSLSALATEGGMVVRTLYSDDGETRFRDRRPIVLNGIPDFVTRGDLSDRSLRVVLARIPPEERREESDVLAQFKEMLPRVLGALYTAAACALRNLPDIELERLPRMADAAKWITAAESALGVPEGTFLAALDRAHAEASATVVGADPVAMAVARWAPAAPWRGSAGDLLSLLGAQGADNGRDRDWPKSAAAMASALRMLAPDLLAVGIEVIQDEKSDPKRRTRLWTIQRTTSAETDPPAGELGSPTDDTPYCTRCDEPEHPGRGCIVETD